MFNSAVSSNGGKPIQNSFALDEANIFSQSVVRKFSNPFELSEGSHQVSDKRTPHLSEYSFSYKTPPDDDDIFSQNCYNSRVLLENLKTSRFRTPFRNDHGTPSVYKGASQVVPSMYKNNNVTFRDSRALSNPASHRHQFQMQTEHTYSQHSSQTVQLETPQVLSVPQNDGTFVQLKSIREIPEKYRCIFPFAYFNALQSKVFDKVMYSDNPIVVCSPTGSGKTVLFELCIVRLLLRCTDGMVPYKVVYMAPIKALCTERYEDWSEKFSAFGLKCTELTGDTDLDDFHEIQYSHIIFTTPEKWDSMTRRWKDHQSLVQSVRLFFIDEVHLLNDSSRGATMEAVVSRMKTVQVAINIDRQQTNDSPVMRFVAVSATIPNVDDIAAWLDTRVLPAFGVSLGQEYRPVMLRKVVLGYPCSEKQSDFKFDLALSYKLSNVIQTYSENKPTLIFCCTRKSAIQATGILVKDARFVMNSQHRQREEVILFRLIQYSNSMHDSKLQDYVLHGCGFHHAGLDINDRKNVEEMFTRGDLPVLFCTSTLAMGVNLPAHLVVVKGTMFYSMNGYVEYAEAQILQMMGRAGRPQFDTSATAVIMTKKENKAKYEALLSGTQHIESSLHHHLTEHINAEVVLGTIDNPTVAQEWLKSTFLYRRIQENPKHYGAPEGLDKEALGKKLQAMCLRALKSLKSLNLVQWNDDDTLKSTETGVLMARYCINFESLSNISSARGQLSIEELINLLSNVEEFKDITIRQNEKKVLNMLNKDKNRVTIRFPMNSKIKTTPMKVNCLMQATLGCLTVNEFSLNQDIAKIFRIAQRVSRFMMEYFLLKDDYQTAINSIMLCKCIKAKLWENSKYVSRQLDRIGATMSSALVNAGISTFKQIEETNPRELELIVNRHPPFGSQMRETVARLPKLDVIIEQDSNYEHSTSRLLVKVLLLNAAETRNNQFVLLIGDAENNVVLRQKLSNFHLKSGCWSRNISVQRSHHAAEVSVNLIHLQLVGLDVLSSFTPIYSAQGFVGSAPIKSHHPPGSLTDAVKCAHQCCKSFLPQMTKDQPTPKLKKKRSRDADSALSVNTSRESPMNQFCNEIQRRKDALPNIKKIKLELTLQQGSSKPFHSFGYTPKPPVYISTESRDFHGERNDANLSDDVINVLSEEEGQPFPFQSSRKSENLPPQSASLPKKRSYNRAVKLADFPKDTMPSYSVSSGNNQSLSCDYGYSLHNYNETLQQHERYLKGVRGSYQERGDFTDEMANEDLYAGIESRKTFPKLPFNKATFDFTKPYLENKDGRSFSPGCSLINSTSRPSNIVDSRLFSQQDKDNSNSTSRPSNIVDSRLFSQQDKDNSNSTSRPSNIVDSRLFSQQDKDNYELFEDNDDINSIETPISRSRSFQVFDKSVRVPYEVGPVISDKEFYRSLDNEEFLSNDLARSLPVKDNARRKLEFPGGSWQSCVFTTKHQNELDSNNMDYIEENEDCFDFMIEI